MPTEARNIILDRAHEHDANHQEASRTAAVQHMARWTADEEAVLIKRMGEPVHLLARDLGRTLYAVRARLGKLRERGLLD